MKVLLHEMSWQEAKTYFSKSGTAIVPIGSTEQHGPANPLGTDHLIARRIAEEAASRTKVLCLPVVPFGVSPHHRQFWGTISIDSAVFRKYVKEICLSLKYYGAQKIVMVNGHGGNLTALSAVAREMRDEDVFVSIFQWWVAAAGLLPNVFESDERHHAGAEETSMNLALHPGIVNRDRMRDEQLTEHHLKSWGITFPLDSVDETPSGVFGKQTTASGKKGEKIFKVVVNELVEHIKLLVRTNIEELMSKPKV